MSVRSRRYISVMLLMTGIIISIICIVRNLGYFTPDSYSYYDISKTFGEEFGRVHTIRQYIVRSDYNCSFPYLYPLCVFLADSITGFGIYSGVLVNGLVMLLTTVVFLRISYCLTEDEFCGSAGICLLFLNPYYLEEVYSARAIPLSLLLLLLAVFCVVHLYLNSFRSMMLVFATGVLAGLNLMNRMDELSFVGFLFFVLIFYSPKNKRIKTILYYSLGVLIMSGPWILYSLVHFGKLFVSDNGRTYAYVKTEYPNYVHLPEVQYETVFNHPMEWIKSRIDNLGETMVAVFSDLVTALPILMFLLGAGLLGFVKKYGKKVTIKNLKDHLPETSAVRALFIVLVYTLTKFLMYVVVGYINRRYFAETIALMEFTLLLFLWKWIKNVLPKYTNAILICALVMTLSVSGVGTDIDKGKQVPKMEQALVEELDLALREQAQSNDRVLLVGKSLNGFRLGAINNRSTYVSPENVSVESVLCLMKQFTDPEWVALRKQEDDDLRAVLSERYSESEYASFYLYHVSK